MHKKWSNNFYFAAGYGLMALQHALTWIPCHRLTIRVTGNLDEESLLFSEYSWTPKDCPWTRKAPKLFTGADIILPVLRKRASLHKYNDHKHEQEKRRKTHVWLTKLWVAQSHGHDVVALLILAYNRSKVIVGETPLASCSVVSFRVSFVDGGSTFGASQSCCGRVALPLPSVQIICAECLSGLTGPSGAIGHAKGGRTEKCPLNAAKQATNHSSHEYAARLTAS